jgi:hypothetical protein
MLESLEGREMYAVDIISAGIDKLGVLQVRTMHKEGTAQNDAIAFSMVNKQLQVLNEANQVVKSFSAEQTAQIKAIDLIMGENAKNLNVDLTGLGKLPGSARHIGLGEGQSADVQYTNQRGEKVTEAVKEYDQGGRHNKETALTIGNRQYKVVEQSWQAGDKTNHFVTVDGPGGRWVTGEDNGNGFVVKSQKPGVSGSEVTTRFDRYGGMWDGQAWVPEAGQKLMTPDGQNVLGEWQDGKWRVYTYPDGGRQIDTYEGFGRRGEGANLVFREIYDTKTIIRRNETYEGGQLVQRGTEYQNAKGLVVVGERQTDGTWKERLGTVDKDGQNFVATTGVGSRTEVYDKADGRLLSRVRGTTAGWVEESWANGFYIRNVWTKQDHGAVGSADHVSRTVIKDGIGTTETFHAKDVQYVGGWQKYKGDAYVKARYLINADGTLKELLSFEIRPASYPNYLRQYWTKGSGWKGVDEPYGGWKSIYGGDGTPTLTHSNVARFLPSLTSGELQAGPSDSNVRWSIENGSLVITQNNPTSDVRSATRYYNMADGDWKMVKYDITWTNGKAYAWWTGGDGYHWQSYEPGKTSSKVGYAGPENLVPTIDPI